MQIKVKDTKMHKVILHQHKVEVSPELELRAVRAELAVARLEIQRLTDHQVYNKVEEKMYTKSEFINGLVKFQSDLTQPELACKIIDSYEEPNSSEIISKIIKEWFEQNVK